MAASIHTPSARISKSASTFLVLIHPRSPLAKAQKVLPTHQQSLLLLPFLPSSPPSPDIIKMANEAEFQEALLAQEQRPMLRFNVVCAGLDEPSVAVDEDLVVATLAPATEAPEPPAPVVEEEVVAEVATVPLGGEGIRSPTL